MINELVVVVKGKAVTTSLEVAEVFGKRHDNVLQSIQSLKCSDDFTALNFQGSKYTDPTGRTLPMYYMTKDGFTMLVMGFTGEKAFKFKEAYITAFNSIEAELVKLQIENENLRIMQSDPEWGHIRIKTKEMFVAVNMILQETRKIQCKETEPYHYANEARLMNKALTGSFDKVDRHTLSKADLKRLNKIEIDNSRLIIQGLSYDERKNILLDKYIIMIPEC